MNIRNIIKGAVLLLFFVPFIKLEAQDRLKQMPGYEQYQEVGKAIRSSVKTANIRSNWAEDSKSFTYVFAGKEYNFDINKEKSELIGDAPPRRPWRWSGPKRGRQYPSAESPNGKWNAYTHERNMWISKADGSDAMQITVDGNMETLLKYGIATWVYGEELGQNTAMWWSPDSRKIAFYRFEEAGSEMYYVLYNQTRIQDSVEIEAYPKVGAPNLPVDLMVYDLETKETRLLETRDGKAFSDDEPGTYIYGMDWTKDGKELLFHRTNRKQNIMEYCAADPETGKSRVVVREEWLNSWTENTPTIIWLEDGKHFIWESERNGFRNYYLYHLEEGLKNAITSHDFEIYRIIKLDEDNNMLYYMARSGDNHMKFQLHMASLDGKSDMRLTDPAFTHTVSISPDNKYFVDMMQTHNRAPVSILRKIDGKKVATIVESDLSKFESLGLRNVEVFTFTSADGKTELHGMLHFPSDFDPNKKYPLLLANYGGPATNAFSENFTLPNSLTEYGFLVASIDGRNVRGRGKAMLDQLYGNLCIVEMDDFAAGVRSLYDRPYVDKNRVGAYGTSYGGTTAAACLLRFPDVFHVAVANSAVTDWRNYDNIYTERYMNTLEDNPEGYERSKLMNYAKDLEGRLMIFFGTSDNNVHPSNSLQLIKSLQDAGKSFEVQVGPDVGHAAMNRDRMMEFFIENLVLRPHEYKKDKGIKP